MSIENGPSRFSDDPAYKNLDPKVQEVVDFLDQNYDNPTEIALKMAAYIEKHRTQAD